MKKLIFSLMTLFMAAPALAEEAVQETSLLAKGLIVTAGRLKPFSIKPFATEKSV